MRRFRRKRQKFTWLPILGQTASGDEGSLYTLTTVSAEITATGAGNGPSDLYVTPIVPDQTFFGDNPTSGAGQTLRDLTEGQDWLLKRIVGRLSVALSQVAGNDTVTAAYVLVGAGFFVMRANDSNESIPDSQNIEIDPLGARNVRQPWIWRRTWLLHNSIAVPTAGAQFYTMPGDNVLRAGNAEGPVVDSKIARRIRREERLWFVINAYAGTTPAVALSGGTTGPGVVAFSLDYRVLGAMRRSNNRSTF